MANLTLTEFVAQIPTVTAPILTIVGQVLELFTSQPILVVFVACAFIGIAVKYGKRLLRAAHSQA